MNAQPEHGSTVLWEPGEIAKTSPMRRFLAAVSATNGADVTDYRSALEWSVADPAAFWDAVRRHFEVVGDWRGPALEHDRMPGAVWYPQSRTNYAENLLRSAAGADAERVAIVHLEEDGGRREMTWGRLASSVSSVAADLRARGVRPGDTVAAVLPNIPETVVALLATAAVGAIWSVCSPDLSAPATISRLSQLDPVALFGSTGYNFNGKWFDRREHLRTISEALPTVRAVIRAGEDTDEFDRILAHPADPVFERVPFDHPLWILFTSGTTGTPKGIVHGHGGMLLEGLKLFGLHVELTTQDRFCVAANTSWMVWNLLVASLLTGGSIVTYSGSSTYPREDRQFGILAETGVTVFGAGAGYLKVVQDAGRRPGESHDLSAVRVGITTGSTLADATSLWLHEQMPKGFRLADSSGGTDICSAFIGGNPLEPVRLGRMQGPMLGVALDVYDDDGHSVRDEVGELVITRPMPAMPVGFWNDPDGRRYRAAYFERFPGVWTHGDWVLAAPDGTCEVLGRSDATLNRGGVRLGSAEIYGALQGVPGIVDAMVLGIEVPGGGYWMPLFVVLDGTRELDDSLLADTTAAIRSHASARHVPDEIIAVPEIPVTHTGKKVEVPVKRLFLGADPAALDRGALANPDSLDWFVRRATEFLSTHATARAR